MNALATEAASAWYLTLKNLLATFATHPWRWGHSGLRWRGCHNSTASFYSCAAEFPPKSLGGREEVSLTPMQSSRPEMPLSGYQADVDRSEQSYSSPPGAVHLRGVPDSLVHRLCTGNAVYEIVKLHIGRMFFPQWVGTDTLHLLSVIQKFFIFLNLCATALLEQCQRRATSI